jgi:hypothetical protein
MADGESSGTLCMFPAVASSVLLHLESSKASVQARVVVHRSELVMGAEHRSAALFPHTSCPRQQPSRARQEPRPAQTHDGHGQWESALLARQQLFTAS